MQLKWSDSIGSSFTGKSIISLDCTDFHMQEPVPFNPKWYSYELNGFIDRYEIALSIVTGWAVWAFGPFKCRAFNDMAIFKQKVQKSLAKIDFVVADRGY